MNERRSYFGRSPTATCQKCLLLETQIRVCLKGVTAAANQQVILLYKLLNVLLSAVCGTVTSSGLVLSTMIHFSRYFAGHSL